MASWFMLMVSLWQKLDVQLNNYYSAYSAGKTRTHEFPKDPTKDIC